MRHAQPPDLHLRLIEASTYIQEGELYVFAVRLTEGVCLHLDLDFYLCSLYDATPNSMGPDRIAMDMDLSGSHYGGSFLSYLASTSTAVRSISKGR